MFEIIILSFCSQVGVLSLLIGIVSSLLQVFVICSKKYQVKGYCIFSVVHVIWWDLIEQIKLTDITIASIETDIM